MPKAFSDDPAKARMATILPEDPKKKQTAFGDSAAQAANPGAGFVAPAMPAAAAPLGMVSDGMTPPSQRLTMDPNATSMGVSPMGMIGGGPMDVPQRGATTPPGSPIVTPPPAPYGGRGAINPARAQPTPAAPAPVVAAPPAAPLDAQAAADRQAAGGFIGGVKDLNNRAAAAIMDVGLLAPRALLGAYDTAVVRPVRAAGVDMAYTSPLVTPAGSDPSSMTPMYDRIRAQDAAAAAGGAPVVGGAPGARRAAQADVRRVDNALAPPAVGAAASTVPVSPNDASAGGAAAAGPVGAQPGAVGMAPSAATSGAVRRVGNSYSGTNVAGDVSINGREAGGGSMSMPAANFVGGAPGVAATAAQVAPGAGLSVIGTGPAENGMGSAAREKFFEDANLRTAAARSSWSPRGGYQGDATAIKAALAPIENRQRTAEGAMREAGESARATLRDTGETARLGVREAGDTTRTNIREAGDDRRAAATNARLGVRDALDRDEFGLKKTAAEYDNRGRARLEAAQLELQKATTPEAIRTATQKVLALGGKEANANRYTVIPGGQTVDPATGQAVREASTVLDNQTGQLIQPGGAAASQQAPAPAIAALKANPALAAQFDQKYGAGASARALGQQK